MEVVSLPNNINGRGLTEREMMQLCLELAKGRVPAISHTLMETTHDELIDIYEGCLKTSAEAQREIFQLMEKKGWYETQLATVEEIENVQNFMQNNLNPSPSE